MVLARLRTAALAAGGLSAVTAAIAATLLISMILHPVELALAMSGGDFLDAVAMIVRQLVALCVRLVG